MQQATTGQSKASVPPYLPYKTFTGYIDSLKQGVPSHIDRSTMATMAGNVQTNLLNALRYLELIQEHGAPTERLYQFVKSEGAERQGLLREMLRSAYGFLWTDGFDLSNATGATFDERFKRVASGDTARKAEAFFLAAAKDADMPISRFITARGSRGPRSRQRRPIIQNGLNGKASQTRHETQEEVMPPPPPPPGGNTKTVTFSRGGILTVSVSVDLFTLTRHERDFVLGLIDQMNEFEQNEIASDSTLGTPSSDPYENDEDEEELRF